MKVTIKQLQALFKYLGALYPMIMAFVRQAEEAGGSGSEKLAAVRAAIERVWNGSVALAQVWDGYVKPAIEAAVVIFNIRGIFKKS